jgi:hypothetical protein
LPEELPDASTSGGVRKANNWRERSEQRQNSGFESTPEESRFGLPPILLI